MLLMTVDFSPLEVRRLVAEIFEEFLDQPLTIADLDETIRCREGRAMARSYRACGMFAMWLISVGLLQFYDEDGNMLRTVNLLEDLLPMRAAA
jgi:hypothetical protein